MLLHRFYGLLILLLLWSGVASAQLIHSWSPRRLGSTLALWLDAADASTVTTVSGGVSQWSDKSGNARHATQGTSGLRPTYTSGVSLSFNAQGLVISSFPTITSGSMFVVQQTADDTYLLLTSSDGASYSWAGKTGSADPVSAGFGTPTYYQNGTSVSWANRGQVYTALHNTTNIVSAIGVAFSSSWNSNLRIAYYTVGNPEFHFQGSIKEIIITSSSLSTADRQRVEGYLAVKYGLRASLGAGHPYKNSPPN